MDIQRLPVIKLRLNPHNDRHGPLRDEVASIQWLLENRTVHMRALAKDIATTKRLFERPLVRKDNDIFIVFDGNRRTCCVKLLLDPALAPSEQWADFFSSLKNDELTESLREIECEIESDLAVIDDTLFRRHTGSQDGVGQSQWDPTGKSFFLQRTGKDSVGLGQSIEAALKAEGLIAQELELPWSNLERLLSSEKQRKRVGISFAGGSLVYLTNKNENLQTLQKISQDLTKTKDRVVLGDLWNNAAKDRYIDKLKAEGFAIDNVPASRRSEGVDPEPTSPRPRITSRGRLPKDRNLIGSADNNPFLNNPDMHRAELVWREMQFELEFDRHDNAVAVLMRVLLELAITYYARTHGIGFGQSDTFAKRVSAVSDSMRNRGLIDDKARSIIRKFETDKPIVSAHSMHQYVHNAAFHPGKSDLKAMWNVIRPIIMHSVK